MHRFNVVANTVCERFGGLANIFYGCAHRRTTFPITLRAGATPAGLHTGPPETYIVCLACGRHLAYDWTAMRVVAGNVRRQGMPLRPDPSHHSNRLQDSRTP